MADHDALTREEYTSTAPTEEETIEIKRLKRQEGRRFRIGNVLAGVTLIGSLVMLFATDNLAWSLAVFGSLVPVVGGFYFAVGPESQRLALEKTALKRARTNMLERLGPDPLGWPVWTLEPQYALLAPMAEKTARAHLEPGQVEMIKARTNHPGTLLTHIADIKSAKLPTLTEVTAAPALTHADLSARHHQLSVEYGEYLTDPLTVLASPLLNDVSDPLTGEFVEDYAALNALGDTSDLVRYDRVLTKAWKSWRLAYANAQKLGTTTMSAADQKKVARAEALLALAMDPGASAHEASVAQEQAEKELRGVLVLPARARALLAGQVQRALTAPEVGATS